MRIMGVDPGSVVTGVAVIEGDGLPPWRLLTAERLHPPNLPYCQRLAVLVEDLRAVVTEFKPAKAVIEMPHGKAHRRMGRVNLASLSIYGAAAGACYATLLGFPDLHVIPVGVNEAARGLTKRARQHIVQKAFASYDADRDTGFDVSDALFLAMGEED